MSAAANVSSWLTSASVPGQARIVPSAPLPTLAFAGTHVAQGIAHPLGLAQPVEEAEDHSRAELALSRGERVQGGDVERAILDAASHPGVRRIEPHVTGRRRRAGENREPGGFARAGRRGSRGTVSA